MRVVTLFEQGLVPVYITETGEQVVDGRELWEGLRIKTDFSTWVKRRLIECDAIENEDYTSLPNFEEREIGATKRIEYIIKLDTAKEMAMLERNDIGKKVRKYFIAVEKKWKQASTPQVKNLSPEMQMFDLMFKSVAQTQIAQKEQAELIQQIKEDVQLVKEQIATKKQYKLAPVQTELSFETEIYSKIMKKDRISTERIAEMYSLNSRNFYDTLYKLGLVMPGERKGWVLSPEYENKGIGFSQNQNKEYAHVTWTQKGVNLIKDLLKNNGVSPVRRLPAKKRKVAYRV
jgi:phage anti-repressor protein